MTVVESHQCDIIIDWALTAQSSLAIVVTTPLHSPLDMTPCGLQQKKALAVARPHSNNAFKQITQCHLAKCVNLGNGFGMHQAVLTLLFMVPHSFDKGFHALQQF